MNHADFEAIVHESLASLPSWVHESLHNIDVLVLDRPDERHGAETDDLLGLYLGTPLTERSIDTSGELPDVIYIFREPHLALGLGPDELRAEIHKTVVHEVAHYFGIDDDHLDELGWG